MTKFRKITNLSPLRRRLRKGSGGSSEPENLNALTDTADLVVALDRLQAMAPKVESVSLVVAWFGDDLRAGNCKVRPGVEVTAKSTTPSTWSVNGVSRANAFLVSRDDQDRPVYGGTPADFAVVQAIQEMKARGLRVTFYPFILMDVPPGQRVVEPIFRQRRRDGPACLPVAGADHLLACGWLRRDCGQDRHGRKPGRGAVRRGDARQLQRLGSVGFVDRAVRRLGPAAHGAALRPSLRGGRRGRCLPDRHRDAGADDDPLGRGHLSGGAGLSGSARGCPLDPRVRDEDRLRRGLEEYFGHQPGDGSGDVFFHLDPLWADRTIDFIGIDNYMPLSDWRDGFEHADAAEGWPAIYDRAYLQGTSRAAKASTGSMPARPIAPRRSAPRSRMEVRRGTPPVRVTRRTASHGSSATRICAPGGRTCITTARAGWRAGRRRHGCRSPSRSGSPNSAVPPSTGAQTSPTSSSTRSRPRASRRISRGAGATTRSSGPISRRRISGGARPRTTRSLGLRRPDGACPRMRRLDLGRAALSVLSGADRRLDRRRELAARALADRAAGRGVAGGARPAPLPARRAAEGRIDVTGLWGAVEGYAIGALESPRASITTLSRHFGFDAVETEGVIRFVMRGRPPSPA